MIRGAFPMGKKGKPIRPWAIGTIFIIFQIFIHIPGFGAESFLEKDPNVLNKTFQLKSNQDHKVEIIHSGIRTLQRRIELIRMANKTIEVEYYVFKADVSSRLIVRELVKRVADDGVKVRILIDHYGSSRDINPFIAHELKKKGIELRYYNPVPMTRPSKVQYRNHRKALIIDSKILLTGGRNTADKYFDIDPEFNLMDRDILVEGPLASQVRETFNANWKSKPVKFLEREKRPSKRDSIYKKGGKRNNSTKYRADLKRWKAKVKHAKNFLDESFEYEKNQALLDRIYSLGPKVEKPSICKKISFMTDVPGVGPKAKGDTFRNVRQELKNKILNTQFSLIIDSPYFIMEKYTTDVFNEILAKKVKVNLFTNSLYSTDMKYTASVFNDRIGEWIEKGLKTYVASGDLHSNYFQRELVDPNARWGTHSKSAVFDDESFMIGSFNFDPRSLNYNLELAVFCDGNKLLANQIKENIKLRMQSGIFLETPDDVRKYEFNNVGTKKKFNYYMIKIPSALLDHLL